jgi:hypothetical protein
LESELDKPISRQRNRRQLDKALTIQSFVEDFIAYINNALNDKPTRSDEALEVDWEGSRVCRGLKFSLLGRRQAFR